MCFKCKILFQQDELIKLFWPNVKYSIPQTVSVVIQQQPLDVLS